MIDVLAPAKVNLTLHVTGQRADGFHDLDSLVMFADIGDRIRVKPTEKTTLTVTGPMAGGVPRGEENAVMKAAALMGVTADIRLQKHLPSAAGLGSGSVDAAATLRALSQLTGQPIPRDVMPLGADVPVCVETEAARMQGAGDLVTRLPNLPPLHAVLVNPRLPVLTVEVFRCLRNRDNAPMPTDLPASVSASELIEWLGGMRNDLQDAAIEAEPVIEQVFAALEVTPGCQLSRMSGSGGTCFGLYDDAETAASAAGRLQESYPTWWVTSTMFNSLN